MHSHPTTTNQMETIDNLFINLEMFYTEILYGSTAVIFADV